jgi:hypothetical protein
MPHGIQGFFVSAAATVREVHPRGMRRVPTRGAGCAEVWMCAVRAPRSVATLACRQRELRRARGTRSIGPPTIRQMREPRDRQDSGPDPAARQCRSAPLCRTLSEGRGLCRAR